MIEIKTFFASMWAKIKGYAVAKFAKIGDAIKEGFTQIDKRKHFVAGALISLIVGVFAPLWGFLVACLVGVGKEWWDYKGNGTAEWLDLAFTCLGAFVALPLALIINWIIW